jgi:hypothetical protein
MASILAKRETWRAVYTRTLMSSASIVPLSGNQILLFSYPTCLAASSPMKGIIGRSWLYARYMRYSL